MAAGDAEFVRHVYETLHAATGRADLHALTPFLAADFRFVNPSDALKPGTRRGLQEWEEVVRQYEHAYEWLQYDVHALREAGDSVVALVTMHARGRESGNDYLEEEAHVWTVDDGRITEFAWFQSHGEALESAGLAE